MKDPLVEAIRSLTVRPAEKLSGDAVVICLRADMEAALSGNLRGVCRDCGCEVQFSRTAPDAPKICIDCARSMIGEDLAAGRRVKSHITPEQLEEYATFHSKPEGSA